jgi:ribosomal protein L25 (general stress protein Ctc)
MQNVKTTCEIKTYDSEEEKTIVVKSGNLYSDRITLEIDGKKYVVIAQELEQAIKRCTIR